MSSILPIYPCPMYIIPEPTSRVSAITESINIPFLYNRKVLDEFSNVAMICPHLPTLSIGLNPGVNNFRLHMSYYYKT